MIQKFLEMHKNDVQVKEELHWVLNYINTYWITAYKSFIAFTLGITILKY